MRHRFGNDQIVLMPTRDLPPCRWGLVWCTARENARIRALAEVARALTGRQPRRPSRRAPQPPNMRT
jgi:hypothetical protein